MHLTGFSSLMPDDFTHCAATQWVAMICCSLLGVSWHGAGRGPSGVGRTPSGGGRGAFRGERVPSGYGRGLLECGRGSSEAGHSKLVNLNVS